jgi:hypothetical protein
MINMNITDVIVIGQEHAPFKVAILAAFVLLGQPEIFWLAYFYGCFTMVVAGRTRAA